MADDRRRTGELGFGEFRHLHHLAVAVADVIGQDVLQLAAIGRLGLDVDIAHLAALIGETGVVAAGQHGDGVHRLLKIDVQGPHDLAVDIKSEGRRTRDELGVKGAEGTGCLALDHQFVGQLIKLHKGETAVALVVELEVEAALG